MALRLGCYLFLTGHPDRRIYPDTGSYVSIASHFWSAVGGNPSYLAFTASRPPGYPALLAVIGAIDSTPGGVAAVQVAIGTLTIGMTYYLARMWTSRSISALAAFLLAVDPISVVYSNLVLTETLFTFALLAATIVWIRGLVDKRPKAIVLAGLLFGLGALIKPITVYALIFLVPSVFVALRPRWRHAMLVAAGLALAFALPVGTWVTRNVIVLHVSSLTTVDSYNLAYYWAAPALAHDQKLSLAAATAEIQREEMAKLGSEPTLSERASAEMSVAMSELLHHPLGAAYVFGRGEFQTIFGRATSETDAMFGLVPGTLPEKIVVAFETAFSVLVACAAAGCAWACRRRLREPWTLAVLALCAYMILLSSTGGYSRFRVPIEPYLAILAARGISSVRQWARQRVAARAGDD